MGRAKVAPRPARSAARLSIEPLEDRTLLAVSLLTAPSSTGNNFTFSSNDDLTSSNDSVYVQTSPRSTLEWSTDGINYTDTGVILGQGGTPSVVTFHMTGQAHIQDITGGGGALTFEGSSAGQPLGSITNTTGQPSALAFFGPSHISLGGLINTMGGDLTIAYAQSVEALGNAVITTRTLAGSQDYLHAASTGNSGNLTIAVSNPDALNPLLNIGFDTPQVTLDPGTQIDTQAINPGSGPTLFTPGSVTLTAANLNYSPNTSFFADLAAVAREADVTVGNTSSINAGNVVIDARAGDIPLGTAIQAITSAASGQAKAGLGQLLSPTLLPFQQFPSIPVLGSLVPNLPSIGINALSGQVAGEVSGHLNAILGLAPLHLPISVIYKSSSTSVTIGQGASITSSGSVAISTEDTAVAVGQAAYTFNTGRGASIAFGYAQSNAQTLIEPQATIQAAHNVSITSQGTSVSSNSAQVGQPTDPSVPDGAYQDAIFQPGKSNQVQVSAAIGLSNITSLTTVSSGAAVEAGGSVTITSTGNNSNSTSASTSTYTDGTSGVTVDISQTTTNIHSQVDGTVVANGTHAEQLQTFDPLTQVDFGSTNSIITFPKPHGLQTGDAVIYNPQGGGALAPLQPGSTYYVIAQTATQIRLAADLPDALAGNFITFNPDPTLSWVPPSTSSLASVAITQVNESNGEIVFGFDPGLTSGEAVVYRAVAGEPIGNLVDGDTYYVKRVALDPKGVLVDPNDIQLSATPGGPAIPLNLNLQFSGLRQNWTVMVDGPLITAPFAPGFEPGASLVYQGDDIPGLTPGTTYYVLPNTSDPSGTSFWLSTTPGGSLVFLPVNNPTSLSLVFDPGVAFSAADNTFDVGFNLANAGLTNGTPLTYQGALGTLLAGLNPSTVYYAVLDPQDPSLLRLAPSSADAQAAYQTAAAYVTGAYAAEVQKYGQTAADAELASDGEQWAAAGFSNARTAPQAPAGPYLIGIANNEIVLPFATGFAVGDQVFYEGPTAGQPLILGLTPFTNYFVVPDPNKPDAFGLALSGSDASQGNLIPIGLPAGVAATTINLGVAQDAVTATVDSNANTLTFTTSLGISNDDAVVYHGTADGTPINGLTPGTTYYAIINTGQANVLQLASSLRNAESGIAIPLSCAQSSVGVYLGDPTTPDYPFPQRSAPSVVPLDYQAQTPLSGGTHTLGPLATAGLTISATLNTWEGAATGIGLGGAVPNRAPSSALDQVFPTVSPWLNHLFSPPSTSKNADFGYIINLQHQLRADKAPTINPSLAGSFAFQMAVNNVQAEVGATAVLQSASSITIGAKMIQHTTTSTRATLAAPQQVDLSAAASAAAFDIALQLFEPTVLAQIDDGAHVDAYGNIAVNAALSYPSSLPSASNASLPINLPLLGNVYSLPLSSISNMPFDVQQAWADWQFITGNPFNDSNSVTTVSTPNELFPDGAGPGFKLGISGVIDVGVAMNNVQAIVGSAFINQNPSEVFRGTTAVPNLTQSLNVLATTDYEESSGDGRNNVHLANGLGAFNFGRFSDWNPAQWVLTALQPVLTLPAVIGSAVRNKDLSQVFDTGLGLESAGSAVGGTLHIQDVQNTTLAQIDTGAQIDVGPQGSLTVQAINLYRELSLNQAGAAAGAALAQYGATPAASSGFSGTGVWTNITDTTEAIIQPGVTVMGGGALNVLSSDTLDLLQLAGAVELGTNKGYGFTASGTRISRTTLALIGNPNGGGPAGNYQVGSINVQAANEGLVIAGTVAAATANQENAVGPGDESPLDGASLPLLFGDSPVPGSQGLGLSGALSVNLGSDVAQAEITDPGTFNVSGPFTGTATSGGTTVNATDQSVILSVAGGLALSTQVGGPGANSATAVAGALGYNDLSSTVQASIIGASLAGTQLNVTANQDGFIGALAAGGAGAAAGGAAPGNGTAGTGSVTVNVIQTNTQAFVSGASLNLAGSSSVQAHDDTDIWSLAGSGAFGSQNGFGGALAVNLIGDPTHPEVTSAYLTNSHVLIADGTLSVTAQDADQPLVPGPQSGVPGPRILAITGSAGVSQASGAGAGFTISVNFIASDVSAYLNNQTTLDVHAGAASVVVSATDLSSIVSVGGGLGVGNLALGAAVGYNQIAVDAAAYLDHAKLNIDGPLTVSATGQDSIAAGSLGIAVGTGGGNLGLAGSATINQITNTFSASITNSQVMTGGAIALTTTDGSSIIAVAGGVAAGTNAAGAAVGYNLIANSITSSISASTVASTGSSVTLSSDSAPFLVSVAAGGAGADKFAFGGAVTVNSITNDVDSHISGGSHVSAAGDAGVRANESATMLTAAGGIAVSTGQSGGAVGAAIASNFVGGGFNPSDPNQASSSPTATDGITAYIDDSTVNVGGSLTVAAGFGPPSSLPGSTSLTIAVATVPLPEGISDQVTSLAVAGAFAGSFALGGAIDLNFIDNTIDAHISGGSQVTADSVALGAQDSSTIQSLAGQFSISIKGGLGPVSAVGAAVVVNQIDNTIRSYVDGSTATATDGDVTDEAQSTRTIQTMAAGISGGQQTTLAGSAVANMIGGTTDAYFHNATVTAEGNVLVLGTDANTIQALGGTVAFSLNAVGAGGTVVVDELTNTTRARIENSTVAAKALTGTPISIPSWASDTNGTESSQSIRGLAVAASTSETINDLAVSIGLAGTVGIGLNPVVNQVADTTDAHISGSTINSAGQWGQSVKVRAHQSTNITSASGALGGGLKAGAGAAVDADLLGSNTDASISGSPVYAGHDVEVSALTREQVVSATAGLGLGSSAGLAGGASDVHLTGTTQAFINDGSTIITGGDLSVTAHDEANLTLGVGALGGGVGLAAGGAIAVGLDGDQTSAQIAGATASAAGNTLVQANSTEDLTTTAVGAAGGALALNVALAIIDLSGSTTAAINGGSVTSGGSVQVLAGDTPTVTDHLGSGGAGTVAVGAGVEVVAITNTIDAHISTGSQVTAGGAVQVTATGVTTVNSVVVSAQFAGGIALNGTVSLISIGTGLDGQGAGQVANLASSVNTNISLSGGVQGLNSQFGPSQQAQAGSVSNQNVSGALSSATPPPPADTNASIGAGAVVHAGGDLSVTATDTVTANPLVGQATAGGLAGFGGSASIVDVACATAASIGNNATVDAGNSGPGNLTVTATFTDNVTPQVYAGTASSYVGLGAQVAIINDSSSQSATIGSGATLARAGTVNIEATANRTLNLQAAGVTASLLVAAGAAISQANVTGGTTAALGSQANVGGGAAGNVVINAHATDAVTTNALAVTAGILSGNGADATSTVTPTVAATIGSGGFIDLTGDASVLATATTNALATTTGVNVSALGFSDPSTLGGSVSTVQVAPTITASVGSGTVLDVADLTLRAFSDDTSTADASASAGTLLAGDAGAQANSSVTPAVSATTGSGVQVNAAKDVTIEAVSLLTSVASAPGISVSGLVGVAQNAAGATGSPTLTAQAGNHDTFHAGTILIEGDYQDSSFDPGHANLGTSATATTTGGGGLVGTVGSSATAAHDLTETSSVGPGSSLNATGKITIENTSGSLDSSGNKIVDAQASASGDAVGGLASGGTTNATVSMINQYTAAVDSDPADPTTIAAGSIVTIENVPNTQAASNVNSSNMAGLGSGGSISSTILDNDSSLVHLEQGSTVQGSTVTLQNSPFIDLTPEITGNAGSALASVELASSVAKLTENNQIDLDPNVTVMASVGVSMDGGGYTFIEAGSAANSTAGVAFATATSDLVSNRTDAISIGANDLIQGDDQVDLSANGINSLGSEAATYIAGIGGTATSNADGIVDSNPTITVAPGARINSFDVILFADPTVDVGLEAVAVANTLQAYFANFINSIDFFGFHTNLDNGEHPNTFTSRTDNVVVNVQGQINLIDYGTVDLTISPQGTMTGTFTDPEGLTGPVGPLTLTKDSSGNYHLSGLTNTIVKTTGHAQFTNQGQPLPEYGNPYQLSMTSGITSNDLTYSAASTIIDQGPITEVPVYTAVTINSQLTTPLYIDSFNSTASTPNDTLPTITFTGNGTPPVPQVDGQSAASLTVNADWDVYVNGFINAGQGPVVIDTTGNIFTGPPGSGIQGQSLTLKAGSGSLGTAAAPLTVVLENDGELSGSAAGNAYFAIERPESASSLATYGPFSDVPLIQNLSTGGNAGLTLEGGIYYDDSTGTYQTRAAGYELQDVQAQGTLSVNNTAGNLIVDHGVTAGSASPKLTAVGGVSNRTATPVSGATGSLAALGSLGLPALSDGAVAWGDFNNHGFLSVAIAGRDNQGNFVTELWVNNGDGTFTQDSQTQLVGVDHASLSWVDVLGTGRLDLLVTGRNSARVPVTLLYLNNGDGSFTLDTNANLPGVENGSAAWGDLNHDGLPDLVLTGDGASGPITEGFLNNGTGTFTPDTQANLPGLTHSSVALGDSNNDGNLDILLAGQTAQGSLITEVFTNNGTGTFTLDSQANLPGVEDGAVAWGDFNNDGYLDILLTGTSSAGTPLAEVFQNKGGTGAFTNINASLDGVTGGTAAWADFNGSGDLGILLTGTDAAGNPVALLDSGNGSGTFTQVAQAGLTGVSAASAAWGDLNHDGKPDLIVTGQAGSAAATELYLNSTSAAETPVSAPTGLLFSTLSPTSVLVSWDPPSGVNPANGSSYNLLVGTAPGTGNVVDPMANPATGQLSVARRGSIQGTSWQINGLTPGQTYYWTVQAVSPSLAGSPFAVEQTFNTDYPAFAIHEGMPITLSAAALDNPTGGPETYAWTINGHADAASGASPTLTWPQLQALGIDEGPATFPVTLQVSGPNGLSVMRMATIALADTPPAATFSGLPSLSEIAIPITLTASVTSPSAGATQAGFNDVWQVSNSSGQSLLAGQALSFTGRNPIALPSGAISGASNLTVTISFQTTSGGVILGEQNQPIGTTPTPSIPILYVGTNGLLYAEALDGSAKQLVSTQPVNDGQVHQLVLTESGGSASLTLDGTAVGTLSGLGASPSLTVAQLGTGSTSGATDAPNGFDPFVGTISQVQIAHGTALAGSLTFPAPGNGQVTFTPPSLGTYSVTLSAGDRDGGTGLSPVQSVNAVPPTPAISGLPSTSYWGAPITLTATQAGAGAMVVAGLNNVWSVSTTPGQEVVAGQDLVFNGSDPISLPSGLITNAATLTAAATFQTTSAGVILGYQNQPTSAAPTQYMPALYVGTDGLLDAEIFDGSFREMVSSTKVNDGKVHTAVLVETGTAQSLTLDGTLIATLSGTPNPLSMTDDQLGTGYTVGYPNTNGVYFPFTGTIDSLTITSGTALAGSVALAGSSGNQIAFTPPAVGTYTVGLSSTNLGDLSGSTSQTLTATDVAPTPAIGGLPATVPAATPIALTASVNDPDAADTAAGFNDVWSISAGPGQQIVAAQDLTFNGSNPIALPSGLFAGGWALTVSLSFQTTSAGVILGYQNQPTSAAPTQYMPALYVGTDGLLDAEIFDGSFREMVSSTKVNDGKVHTAVLVETGTAQSLTLDGTLIATLSGTPNPLSMTDDQLGTGYTLGHPSTPGAYFPFTGTIDSLTITEGSALAGSLTVTGTGGTRATFTPPAAGTDTVGLSSTDVVDTTGGTSQSFTAADIAPTPRIGGIPASGSPDVPISLTATTTDPIPSDTAAGFNEVWSVSAGPGQQAVAASNLIFNGSNPVALPMGLIHDATSLVISLTFQTTGDGVLLGYQDTPLGSTPAADVPLLYIGTTGHLFFDLYNGSSPPLSSATVLNDGQLHTVTIQWINSSLSYSLDSQTSGTISGFTPQMLDMTFDELGTGYASGYPAASNGYFPFTGTIKSLTINSGTAVDGALNPNPYTGNQASFTPYTSATYTIGLSSTDVVGSTGTTSQPFTTLGTTPVPAITGLPAASPEGTPVTVTGAATEAIAAVAAQGFSYLWQASDADGASATSSGALSFNGVSQYVDLGNPTDLDFSGRITLDAWIKPESTGGLQDIIAHGYQVSPTDAEDFLRILNGSYQVGSWNGNNAYAQAAIPAGDVGQWVNLAGVYDGTQWLLYRDGVQVAASGPTTQGALPVTGTDWAIGARGTGNERFFQGEIDDASIWNVGLSAAAVKSAMVAAPTAPETGLVAYYPFDEAGGNLAIDAAGNGNNGTLGGIQPNNPAAAPTRVAGIVLSPSVTITPGESGIETVTLQAFDAAGGSGVVTATFTATAVPITVNAGGNVVVQQGTPLTRTCSFTDPPGDGPWTATVLYGDGTPIQPLTVHANQTFTLSHTFANAGTFTTTVTVTNRDGVSGSFSYTATVTGFTVNDGSPQQSMVTSLTYTFNNPTQVEPGAFVLLRNGKPSKIHLHLTPQPDGMTYLITFSGPGVVGGSVPDGNYTLITWANKVKVLSGPPMTANDVNTFVRLFGDVEGVGVVNTPDKALLEQAEADPNSPDAADFEYDGKPGIDKADIAQFHKRYKHPMDPPKRAPAKFAGRTVHHHGAVRTASVPQRPAGIVAVPAKDPRTAAAIGVLAPRKEHSR